MSFWGNLGKIVGIGAAPFTGGASLAALAIPAAIGAGADIAGGLISSHAQGKAADKQAQAARDALQFEKDVYNRDLTDYGNSLGTLVAPTTLRLGDLMQRRTTAPTVDSIFGSGGYQSLGQMRGMAAPQMPAQSAQGGQMVNIRSPKGTVKPVPAEHADFYISRGGQVVA